MMDPQARSDASGPATELFGKNDSETDHAVRFQFSLAWSSLFLLLEQGKSGGALAPFHRPIRTPVAGPKDIVEKSPSMDRQKAAPGSTVNWEMVVPKMARPAARPDPGTAKAPAPATPSTSAPKFYTASSPLLSRPRGIASILVQTLLGVAAVGACTMPLWYRAGPAKPHMVEVASMMGEGGWVRERVTSDGFKLGRQLVLYRPSLGAADCRIEFTWRVDEKGLGWVFRAKDINNYYAVRIKVVRPGPAPTLAVEHFTVYQGTQSAYSDKVLAFSRSIPALSIRMEVAGPSFTLYLQGSAAEYWTDTRLTTGGVGFYEERNQPAEVQSLRISFSAPASGGA